VLLQFIKPFGHHKPGDVIEVPDGAEFDHSYLTEVESGNNEVEDSE
jgi:hypothetical protein